MGIEESRVKKGQLIIIAKAVIYEDDIGYEYVQIKVGAVEAVGVDSATVVTAFNPAERGIAPAPQLNYPVIEVLLSTRNNLRGVNFTTLQEML